MVGDGVIAESKISFKMTWVNPGNGKHSIWDQNKQEIYFHSSDIYPDLQYTKAQGIATYYKYTTIDRLLVLIEQINEIIDSKLEINEETKQIGVGSSIQPTTPTSIQKQTTTSLQTTNSQIPSTINKDEVPGIINKPSNTPKNMDDITNKKVNNDEETSSDVSRSYTVVLHATELSFIDAQLYNASLRIRHKVSENLFRKVNDETIDNTEKIWIEVKMSIGKTQRLEMSEFETEAGINLLIELLPTIDLLLTPAQIAAPIKSEEEVNDEDKIKKFATLRRYGREENRYVKSKTETDKAAALANKVKG